MDGNEKTHLENDLKIQLDEIGELTELIDGTEDPVKKKELVARRDQVNQARKRTLEALGRA